MDFRNKYLLILTRTLKELKTSNSASFRESFQREAGFGRSNDRAEEEERTKRQANFCKGNGIIAC